MTRHTGWSRWPWGGTAIAVGGLLRLWMWMITPVEGMLQPDSGSYLSTAEDFPQAFLDGTWFSYRRTPGYPAFVALFGGSPRAVTLVQVVISTAVIGLVLWWGRRLVGEPGGAAAAWLVALEPATIIHSSYVLTETVFTALTVSGVVLLWTGTRRGSAGLGAWAGLVLGTAALVRPTGMYLIPVLAITLLVIRVPKIAFTFVAVGMLIVGGWIARNVVTEDLPSLSMVDSGNMLYWRAAGALAVRDDRDPRDVRAELVAATNEQHWETLGERWRTEHRLGREIIAEHPVEYVRASFIRFGAMLAHVRWTEYHGVMRSIPLFVTALAYLAVYVAAAWGLPTLWRADRLAAALIVSGVGYMVLVSFAPEVHDRFRVPFWPLVAIPAGVGWVDLSGRGRRLGAEPGR